MVSEAEAAPGPRMSIPPAKTALHRVVRTKWLGPPSASAVFFDSRHDGAAKGRTPALFVRPVFVGAGFCLTRQSVRVGVTNKVRGVVS